MSLPVCSVQPLVRFIRYWLCVVHYPYTWNSTKGNVRRHKRPWSVPWKPFGKQEKVYQKWIWSGWRVRGFSSIATYGHKVRSRKTPVRHRDLTTILLKSFDSNNKPIFSDAEIRAQLFTFLFAGYETSSVIIGSLLFHLGDEPEWVTKIVDEFEVNFTAVGLTDFNVLRACQGSSAQQLWNKCQ